MLQHNLSQLTSSTWLKFGEHSGKEDSVLVDSQSFLVRGWCLVRFSNWLESHFKEWVGEPDSRWCWSWWYGSGLHLEPIDRVKVHFPAVILVGCCSFPLSWAQDETSGMEWSGRIVILSSLSGLLDKSFVLESKRKGQMFSVVKKTKQVSVCLETGCISAAVSVGGAGRAL